MDYQAIKFDTKNGIAYVTFNRPEVMNARNQRMRAEIIEAMTVIRNDPEMRVVILTGAGEKSFSAGRDLKEAAQEKTAVVAARQQKLEMGDTEMIANFNKPVIAAINGYALGGGCEGAGLRYPRGGGRCQAGSHRGFARHDPRQRWNPALVPHCGVG